MKRLLLDSANVAEAAELLQSWAINGVTTNPSLIAKEEKGDYYKSLRRVFDVFPPGSTINPRHLSVEVTTLDPDEMIDQACDLHRRLNRPDVNVYIKIPFMLETLRVITHLSSLKIRVNATAIMLADQAKLASDAGAKAVSFFYNRMIDHTIEPYREIETYRSLTESSRAEVICGSIRKADDVVRAWRAGADYVTAPAHVIRDMTNHQATTKAIQQFQRDIDAWLS